MARQPTYPGVYVEEVPSGGFAPSQYTSLAFTESSSTLASRAPSAGSGPPTTVRLHLPVPPGLVVLAVAA